MTESAIRTEALTKSYGSLRAVDRLQLDVRGGEIYGFLGPNGAGKSTTIRCLLGLLRPTRGSVRVLGADPRRPDVRRRMSYLPGDLAMEPKVNVRSLLRWYGDLRGGVPAKRIESLCERLDLDPTRRATELSKGNRQKAGIVQALMHEPSVLVLDEPTSGLDPLVQHTFLRLLRERCDAGACVFFSSHVLAEVERLADRVGILRRGELIHEGRVQDLHRLTRQRVELHFDGSVPTGLFNDLPEVSEVTVDGPAATLVLEGSAGPLLRRVSEHGVTRIMTHQDDLDDVFYALYADDAPVADTQKEGRRHDRSSTAPYAR